MFTEAITAAYERISDPGDRKRSQFLLVKCEHRVRARKALNHFHDIYLPEHKKESTVDSPAKSLSLFKTEDGWVGYKLLGKYIAIVFECPDQKSARVIIQKN